MAKNKLYDNVFENIKCQFYDWYSITPDNVYSQIEADAKLCQTEEDRKLFFQNEYDKEKEKLSKINSWNKYTIENFTEELKKLVDHYITDLIASRKIEYSLSILEGNSGETTVISTGLIHGENGELFLEIQILFVNSNTDNVERILVPMKYFANFLLVQEGQKKLAYLKKRGMDEKNSVIIPHKLRWDDEMTEFNQFFRELIKKGFITLLDDESSDPERILPILQKAFEIKKYSIPKTKNKIPRILRKEIVITQMLKWENTPAEFAIRFGAIIFQGSKTTIFIDLKERERNPIVRILYEIFFIPQEGSNKRIKEDSLLQCFK
jgi:hypothetical protein